MSLNGHQLIGQRSCAAQGEAIHAINPATGERLEPAYPGANASTVEEACQLASQAFDAYRATSPDARAVFLETIAEEIDALGDTLTQRALQETGLPEARLNGERGRTCGQLKLFAKVLRRGEWQDVRVDPALPERAPLPRADLRQRQIPLGPVAVFGASNFPLAFSVAGGDTASALAAGCPVIVKAHSAHPGTSELVGGAIQRAVKRCNLPEGVFSLLYGSGNTLGQALVNDPRIQAVGFTGSRSGGTALLKTAQARPQPIPVYAEMSSINPVLLMPAALEARAEALGQAFIASLNMGAGQFCTNPGLVLALEGEALERFLNTAADNVAASACQTMLTPGIHDAYRGGVEKLSALPQVQEVARGALDGDNASPCQTALFRTTGSDFLSEAALQEEVFGASSLVIACRDLDEMRAVCEHLEGQLTATLHLDDADIDAARSLMPVLERRAGRILANGWPTGVEVCQAMVHGGPWPATSDSRTTSVGSAAIERFLRPVCYQDLPEALLSPTLRDSADLPRLVDGKRQH
jgi:NADP-dependent aldehyde dehydrogenase